ncbi:hypothetical protein QUF80_23150 [Desulfococcaceae bacterium HSG8]|nr:hypothetical protein [Desulfococcaceae bacterium HSG8]
MLTYIYKALYSFREAFSRNSTWLLFCMIVLGFMGADEIIGISSFARFWGIRENGYHALLSFFRSSAFSLEGLTFFRGSFVLAQNETVRVQGRAVMLGDHTFVPKDGRRMPGVVTIKQESETQTKPSRFRGHCRGAVGLLTGSLTAPFATPLTLQLHQGFIHVGQKPGGEEGDRLTMGPRIVHMALEFAVRHGILCVLVPDAYFPGGALFIMAASVWSVEFRKPVITLIIKAKKNCKACFPAEKPEGKRPVGRPRKYGQEVKVAELFDYGHLFTAVRCCVCGKAEEVSIAAFDLIWKPSGSLIRFVLAVTSYGPIVLMCSDPNQDPRTAIELYCTRIRVEVMFDILRNLICAFSYRFWSKLMPRHSRRPKKNRDLKEPSSEALPSVRLCWDAYERFVMLGAIAQGLLQMISLRFRTSVWDHFDIFIRTRSRVLPSERTVRNVITRLLITDIFLSSAPGAIIREIRTRYSGKKSFPRYADPPEKSDDRMAAGQ